MKRLLFPGLLVLQLLLAPAVFAKPKRVIFLAGDNSHAWGQHKHLPGSKLLCEALKEHTDIEAEVITTWPEAAALEQADALVIYADGWQMHPANDKLAELKSFMDAGKGLVAIHWATGIQAEKPESTSQAEDPRRVQWRALMGADFEAYHSISNFWTAQCDGKVDHPAMRGVKPFTLYDECYYHLRESGGAAVTRLVPVHPPLETIEAGLTPYRGNDDARAAVGERQEEQYVAWTFPRPAGGRAFGFTGGHFHWTWANDSVRKMVLNGIVWAAGGEVPAGGIESTTPKAARMLKDLPDRNPGWTEEALQQQLDRAAAGEHVPWLDYTDKPLPAPEVSLFDGKSLEGWEVRPGDEKWWTVRDGMITGGSLEETVAHNTFLATRQRYANFELRLKLRLIKGGGFMNSGVQIRSVRAPGDPEMIGYQVDAGPDWWGKLYDESRRNKVVGEPVDAGALAAAAKDWDWNEYRIVCEGPRIRSWINGVAALDYTEADPKIPLEGLIGLQTHGGGKLLTQFKDVFLRELPPTPGAPTWETVDARQPEKEKASFQVPEGYEIELVASEAEGVGKPITVTWDHAGRMWTMTALEYPVDANENAAEAEAMYQKGGRDRVLVFDEPWRKGPQRPRVFAEGLAIPLGLMPWKNGAMVQYGHEIRYYEDRDGDGKADGHRVVLGGFGIQDSHLFPHQFERAPGGWFRLAQGLFNASRVVRPDGAAFASGAKEVALNQCKLARAKLDGSDFELLTAGPNNIWGFATARDGTEFLQEANDLGHPVSEFIAGTHYPTGSREKLRPYAPQLPESTPGQPMGGTGLSGLALAEDGGSLFAAKWPEEKVFYLANPITNRVQIVTQRKDAKGYPHYTKRDDFLVSSDEWFRPVAVHFGPDGCLYIVDWYNKIISHNEVPRNHPDRDKTRGRIWRVKPRGVEPVKPPDLTALPAAALVGELGGANARVARMAWEELGDRGDRSVTAALEKQALDASLPRAKRLGALWALRELAAVKPDFIFRMAKDKDPAVLRETIEAVGDFKAPKDQEAAMVRDAVLGSVALAVSPASPFDVKCALANAVRRLSPPPQVSLLERLSQLTPPPGGEGRQAYEADFLRYQIRWALESHPAETARYLTGAAQAPIEARMLAVLALPPEKGAPALVGLLPQLKRPLDPAEAALLGSRLGQPEVARAFGALLGDADRRASLLKSLLQLDPTAAGDPALRQAVGRATEAMVKADPGALPLAAELARRFRLKESAPLFRAQAAKAQGAELASVLRTLNEIQAADPELCRAHLDDEDAAVLHEALVGYGATGGAAAVAGIAERWLHLSGAARQFAVTGMLASRESAVAFAKGLAADGFSGFEPAVVERLAAVLGREDPAFVNLLEKVKGLLAPVIRFPGEEGAVIATDLTLEGPFTVESWVKLDDPIDNRDSLLGVRGGGADFNFYDRRLRFYNGAADVVIAERPMEAGQWTHCAVTRDGAGRIALYLDGEPAGVSARPFDGRLEHLDIGRANRAGGTAGRFLEFRIRSEAMTPDAIRREFRTSDPAGSSLAGMRQRVSGDSPGLKVTGGAAVEWTADFPELLTPADAERLAAKFARVRALAERPGDAAAGELLFQATCMTCHAARGEGNAIGPNLSGAGAMGTESLLRNILTPNAQLESGYYRHDVTLADGGLVSGFLASENEEWLVLRPPGADERAIPKKEVKEHRVSKRSLMPEGLLDGFEDRQVTDLFEYLKSLK